MYAHCFKTSGGYELVISSSPTKLTGASVVVKSKKEARAMAAQFNATPWNF